MFQFCAILKRHSQNSSKNQQRVKNLFLRSSAPEKHTVDQSFTNHREHCPWWPRSETITLPLFPFLVILDEPWTLHHLRWLMSLNAIVLWRLFASILINSANSNSVLVWWSLFSRHEERDSHKAVDPTTWSESTLLYAY